MCTTAQEWIASLGLSPAGDGCFVKETYRRAIPESLSRSGLSESVHGDHARSSAAAIYYLIPSGKVGHMHLTTHEEMWHFYAGAPLTLHTISPDGVHHTLQVGPNPAHGQQLQVLVPAGCWLGATSSDHAATGFSLVGCTIMGGGHPMHATANEAPRLLLAGKGPVVDANDHRYGDEHELMVCLTAQ